MKLKSVLGLLSWAGTSFLAAPSLRPEDFITCRISSSDGASLFLKRYPARTVAGEGPPVLCLHGLCANLKTFDLPPIAGKDFEYHGLAEHLRHRGFEVWLLNLRGAGRNAEESRLPPGRSGWTIDDHAVEDLPAAIDRIREECGQAPLVVGHSLGALVTVLYLEGARWRQPGGSGRAVELDEGLALQREQSIRGAVLVAPPVRMMWSDGKAPAWLLLSSRARTLIEEHLPERLPLSRFTISEKNRLFHGPLGEKLKEWAASVESVPFDGLLESAFGPAKNRPALLLTKIREGVLSDCSRDELRQFSESIRAGALLSAGDPPLDYTARYASLRSPFLVVMGRRDRIVDPATVRRDFVDRLDRADCQMMVLDDYGHADLLLGAYAPRDVYPAISDWLAAWAYD